VVIKLNISPPCFTAKFHKETLCEVLLFGEDSRRHNHFWKKSLKNDNISWILEPRKKYHFSKYLLDEEITYTTGILTKS